MRLVLVFVLNFFDHFCQLDIVRSRKAEQEPRCIQDGETRVREAPTAENPRTIPGRLAPNNICNAS